MGKSRTGGQTNTEARSFTALELLDRAVEKSALAALLNAIRSGRSGTLVLSGEPGIGKTMLLEHAIASATDFRLTRAIGVESELEFSFGALHRLLIPFLPMLQQLPPGQREPLESALGLLPGERADRFQVGLGTLTLLDLAAADEPLLCVVDDAQWLDRESAEILGFVARRLYADRIAMVFAIRDSAVFSSVFTGLPTLNITGIPEADARELLARAVGAQRLDADVADRIVTATRGNPLALLELTADLTPGQLDGSSVLPVPLPLGPTLQDIFSRRVNALPESGKTLMLLAAAEPSGDPGWAWRAAEHLGVDPSGFAAAESERLVILGPQITFRHPLIRSAVYHSAPPAERRRIHEALAAASDARLDPDQRAWHRAAAAIGPDEDIASDLNLSAERATQRGGYAAAAALLMRAAELTPQQATRAERQLAAAEAELLSGRSDRARALLDQASSRLPTLEARAHARRLDGAIDYAQGLLAVAATKLVEAARTLQAAEPRGARATMLDALQAALYSGRLGRAGGARAVAMAARRLNPAEASELTIGGLLLDGFATLLLDGRTAAVPHLRRAVNAFQAKEHWTEQEFRWALLGCLAASELWDDQAQHAMATRWVQYARDKGALMSLPVALNYLGWYEVMNGRLDTAETYLEEGEEISRAMGNPGIVGASGAGVLLHLVWRGRITEARKAAADMTRDATARSQGAGITHASSALSVLELSLGNYQAATVHARDVYDEDLVYLGTLALPDLVEAAARGGDRRTARLALDRFRSRARACGTDWSLGVLARCEALLAEDSEADRLYSAGIERLAGTRITTDLARAELLYGEWLRRQGRKRDARERLRQSHDRFEAMGAGAFAERARAELLATGEHVHRRQSEDRDALTPQEARIARLASDGARNPEIAAQLFISQSTVEYHLVKVFRKLGVRSRTELVHALAHTA